MTGTEDEEAEIRIQGKSKGTEKKLVSTQKSTKGKQSKLKGAETPADVTGTESRITLNTRKSKAKPKEQKPSTAEQEIEIIIVSIPQNLDTSDVLPPTPEGERLDHLLYCERCNFSTPDKRYFKKHNTWQCEMLTVVEWLKCPEEGCESLFIHENSLRDHVRQHRGYFNYECVKCGKKFILQNQLARHKKKCCK